MKKIKAEKSEEPRVRKTWRIKPSILKAFERYCRNNNKSETVELENALYEISTR